MVLAMPRLVELVPRRRNIDSDDLGLLARILLRLRADRGWMANDVIARTGFAQPYYSSLETGAIRKPGDAKLLALDRAFELEPGTFKKWLREGPPFPVYGRRQAPDGGAELLFEFLEPGPNGEIVALFRRVPDHLQRQTAEIIKRNVVETLKVMAEDEESYGA